MYTLPSNVVICLKFTTFVVATTVRFLDYLHGNVL